MVGWIEDGSQYLITLRKEKVFEKISNLKIKNNFFFSKTKKKKKKIIKGETETERHRKKI